MAPSSSPDRSDQLTGPVHAAAPIAVELTIEAVPGEQVRDRDLEDRLQRRARGSRRIERLSMSETRDALELALERTRRRRARPPAAQRSPTEPTWRES
jgi:hypothetical protein